MRIVIAGAGIGGLCLALFLHRRGIRPVVLERSPVLEAAGAGVQLGPNATRLLFELGLEAALTSVAVAPEAAQVQSGSRERVLLRLPLGEHAERRWGAPYLQLHRADLQAVLLDAVRSRDAADLRLGAAVSTLDGSKVTAGGDALSADVVVGADGIRSTVRDLAFGPTPPRRLGETAWRALIPIQRTPAVARVWTWPRRHLVAYPVSGGRQLNLVAVTPGDLGGDSWTEPGDPDVLRREFRRSTSYVRGKLDQVESVSRWALADLAPLPRWSDGRVVLLGDAAHAMAPYLAQGAAMAIEDAEALARHVSGPAPLPERLAAYEAERKPRAEAVQAASRRNGAIFHLPEPISTLAFAAARTLDGRDGSAARLDWLYGYRPPI